MDALVIVDSEEDNEPPPPKRAAPQISTAVFMSTPRALSTTKEVECPVCSKLISKSAINMHVEACLQQGAEAAERGADAEAAKPDDAKTPRSKLKLKKGGRLSGVAQGG